MSEDLLNEIESKQDETFQLNIEIPKNIIKILNNQLTITNNMYKEIKYMNSYKTNYEGHNSSRIMDEKMRKKFIELRTFCTEQFKKLEAVFAEYEKVSGMKLPQIPVLHELIEKYENKSQALQEIVFEFRRMSIDEYKKRAYEIGKEEEIIVAELLERAVYTKKQIEEFINKNKKEEEQKKLEDMNKQAYAEYYKVFEEEKPEIMHK